MAESELGEFGKWFNRKWEDLQEANIKNEGWEKVKNILGERYSDKPQPKPKREESSSKPPDSIVGFENEIQSLKSFLLNQKDPEEFKTLAVVGKYGVGKTALCQKLLDEEDVKSVYVPRLWVCMYKKEEEREDSNPKTAIVKRILKELGEDKEKLENIKDEVKRREEAGKASGEGEELSKLLEVLHSNLQGKKYLIVLDDAREEDGWNERLDEKSDLSCGFPKGSGGRVIITSRDEELAIKLLGEEEEKLHRLYPLSDAESVWKIYLDEAEKKRVDVNLRKEFVKGYKNAVVNKSCGLPWAAKALGTIHPIDLDQLTDSADQDDQKTAENNTTTKPTDDHTNKPTT